MLFSGLFPAIADKRLVRLSYFVKIGQAAYIHLANDNLFRLLAEKFVPLMDVLQSIRRYTREFPDLLPIQAYEFWNDTGSQRALSALKQYTSAIPLILDKNISFK